jgi:hypothetical protein
MAVLEQVRDVELVAGAAEAYVITNRMISANIPSELPHLNVFTIMVNDVTDPTQDTLVHVSTVTELSTVPIGRTAGIAAPGAAGTLYLSNVWTSTYGDLQTATNAASTFQSAINSLITAWNTFETSYTAPDPTPAYYTFPAPDTSTVTTLIAAYQTAKQARYQAQLTAAAAGTTTTAAQADYTYKTSLLASAQRLYADATAVAVDIATLISNFNALLTAGGIFYTANAGGVGAAAFLVSLQTAVTQLSSAGSTAQATADAAQNVADANAAKLARTTDSNVSAAALATATTNQASTAQALTSALALEASTLAAVLAVCPNFDLHSIPYVSG